MLILIGAVLALVAARVARSEVVHVGGGASIQAAVDASRDGDVILVGPGIYRETIQLRGRAVTVRGRDGPEVTIIDAEGAGSAVMCVQGETSDTVIEGFTITGGVAACGGGFLVGTGSSPTLRDCVFARNRAWAAGGGGAFIHGAGSRPCLVRCVFAENTAARGAGLLVAFGATARVEAARFERNRAAEFGGGACVWGASALFVNVVVAENRAELLGGGIALLALTMPAAVVNATIVGNGAPAGGGVALAGSAEGSAAVLNSILWHNGPAASAVSGPLVLNHCCIEGGWRGAGGRGIVAARPLFRARAAGDLRPARGSPCIDASMTKAVPASITVDLAGAARVRGSAVDLGAHEAPVAWWPGGVSAAAVFMPRAVPTDVPGAGRLPMEQ